MLKIEFILINLFILNIVDENKCEIFIFILLFELHKGFQESNKQFELKIYGNVIL